MEVIRIPGYTEEEKENIARDFLIPKAAENNGLKQYNIEFHNQAIKALISGYTREAGVRGLEREIGAVFRKIAREITQDIPARAVIQRETIEELLGPALHSYDIAEEEDQVGIATGLAWTENGGDIIFIEVTGFKGQKDITMTGSLGEIMQESAKAAWSYLRNNCDLFGINEDLLTQTDLHIHVPAGAIPKDGPSAGITIAVALASFFTGSPVRRDVAMTGELTLRGRVLPIGGVKEKLLAARRAGIREVILPKKNGLMLGDLPDYVRDGMTIHLIHDVKEAIEIALADSACNCRHMDQPILPFISQEIFQYA
jgi:ATP-dependent Lon protease